LALTVHAGDFNLVGPEGNFEKGRGLIRKRINIEPPSKAGLRLGCLREKKVVDFSDGGTVAVRSYNVESTLLIACFYIATPLRSVQARKRA
jgi:hypothetical protein